MLHSASGLFLEQCEKCQVGVASPHSSCVGTACAVTLHVLLHVLLLLKGRQHLLSVSLLQSDCVLCRIVDCSSCCIDRRLTQLTNTFCLFTLQSACIQSVPSHNSKHTLASLSTLSTQTGDMKKRNDPPLGNGPVSAVSFLSVSETLEGVTVTRNLVITNQLMQIIKISLSQTRY